MLKTYLFWQGLLQTRKARLAGFLSILIETAFFCFVSQQNAICAGGCSTLLLSSFTTTDSKLPRKKKKTCKRGYFFARCLRVYYVESQEMVAVKIKLHFFCFSGNDTFQELLVLRARDISTLLG